MNLEIKKLTLDWHEKEKLPAVNLIGVWTELFDIDKRLSSCNSRMEEVGLGTGYYSQSNELNECVEGVNVLDMYILQLHPYIDSKLDDPLYKGFANGATETISRIRLDQFSTDNLPGITDTVAASGYEKYTYQKEKTKLGFADFLGTDNTEYYSEAGYKGLRVLEHGKVDAFAEIFACQYEAMCVVEPGLEEYGYEAYIKQISDQGSFNHQMDKPLESFVSAVLDITIIKPLIEACTGEDMITHEDLSDLERGMKVVFATIDLITFGTGLAATKAAGLGRWAALKQMAKVAAVDFASNTAACATSALAEELGLPMGITLLLSFASGVTVGQIGNKLVFRNANLDVLGEIDIKDIPELESIQELDDIVSLRDMMSEEEIARYNAYWSKVAEEKMVPAAEEKAAEIIATQSNNSAGPCLSTVYDPELNQLYYGQNFKTTKTGVKDYKFWIENEADPLIQERYLVYKDAVDSGKIMLPIWSDDRYAAHSEIRALDEAIKARRAAGLPVTDSVIKELYVYNIDLRNARRSSILLPKCRCPNCQFLTDGINTIIHN